MKAVGAGEAEVVLVELAAREGVWIEVERVEVAEEVREGDEVLEVTTWADDDDTFAEEDVFEGAAGVEEFARLTIKRREPTMRGSNLTASSWGEGFLERSWGASRIWGRRRRGGG